VAQSRFHELIQTLGNGGEIEVAVDDDPVPVRSGNDSAAETDILDDRQQIVLGDRLHVAPPGERTPNAAILVWFQNGRGI
jgi:hypothetical protein